MGDMFERRSSGLTIRFGLIIVCDEGVVVEKDIFAEDRIGFVETDDA